MVDLLSAEQSVALDLLRSGENVFITGGAGSGKSFLIRHFLREINQKSFPILASTGAAAVLLGGRTFHSFFGLGIIEGGLNATLERAQKDRRLISRLQHVEGIIVDEISMISGNAFMAAETITRWAKGSHFPWGGLRVIVVGDFAQLPPVTRFGESRDWCFLCPSWERSHFINFVLTNNQRTQDNLFLQVLSQIRRGKITKDVEDFLNSHVNSTSSHFEPEDDHQIGTHLLPKREQAENFNLKKLSQIVSEEVVIDSIYLGSEKFIQNLMKSSPVPVRLVLKVGCKVMLIQNDPQKRWVNGTIGTVEKINLDKITIRKSNDRIIVVEKTSFSLQDAEGQVIASVIQFPLILAYATTIHKSQGATLDKLCCDLSNLWEPGQAYVALSRVRSAEGLNLIKWTEKSFIVDKKVVEFYDKLSKVQIDSLNLENIIL